jgi:hypothetical protein
LYGMSKEELLILRKTLNKLLVKGFIRQSTLEVGAPVLFVRKGNRGLRFYYNYRVLNAVIKEDYYLILLISETL